MRAAVLETPVPADRAAPRAGDTGGHQRVPLADVTAEWTRGGVRVVLVP